MAKLAINGGEKIRKNLFPDQNTMTLQEKIAVNRVMDNGRLSYYRANKGEYFNGGPEIQALENEWVKAFAQNKYAYAIACNSATSGLFIACSAIGLKAEDEVIVTPYSMTCSATIPLWFGARPVFADVESDYFCIDVESVSKKLTNKTKAIIAVDLFGQPCDYNQLKNIVEYAERKYGNKIYIISDTAQAPGSMHEDEYAGTIGDISIFSLNFGKHMTCGEGGIILTKNEYLAYKCRMVMNHAESFLNDCGQDSMEVSLYPNMIGLNLRMTELQAAVAREQLKKLWINIAVRKRNVNALNDWIKNDIPALLPAQIRPGCTHSYYVCAFKWHSKFANNLHRDKFIQAVCAELSPRKGRDGEGIQIGCGYIKPIYRMPWAFVNGKCQYENLPVVEDLYTDKLLLTLYHAPNSTLKDVEDVAQAFYKVWEYRDELK